LEADKRPCCKIDRLYEVFYPNEERVETRRALPTYALNKTIVVVLEELETLVPNAAMAVSMPSDSDADMSTAALQRCLGQVVLGCGLRVAADAEC